jgi:LysR family glycine cleavage system transcriptional activator
MARRLPPLNALRAFEAAARHLSFVDAADELSVTPAAVSHQVKALEAHLGLALFQRLPRGLVLTEQARVLAP